MRGAKRSDPVSVELYTKKYEGFMIGVSKVDIKKLNVNNCQEHLDILADQYDKIIDNDKSFAMFKPYRDVLQKFCSLASIGRKEAELEDKIDAVDHEIEKNQTEISYKETLLATVDVH